MTILIRWLFIIPAYFLLFIGYMLTPDTVNMTFLEWLTKYAYIK